MGEFFARRYELLDPIADGGMGSVWRVLDHQDGEVRAAKLLRQSDAGSLMRFMREQSTRIHHPNVVTPLSWSGEDNRVLFTMPLMQGGSVDTLVGDWGPLPEGWVVAILAQALAGLDAVHCAGVVHRDVKPANLLLEATGIGRPHVRLSDFGIAIPVDQPRLTSPATVIGTPGYIAPEVRAGADPHPRQDIFALATVGLEMLIGHPPPFVTDEIPSTAVGGILVAATNPDPDLRPATAGELLLLLAPHQSRTWDPAGVEVLDQFGAGAVPAASEGRSRTTVLLHEESSPGRAASPPGPVNSVSSLSAGPPRSSTRRPEPSTPAPRGDRRLDSSLLVIFALAFLGVALMLTTVVLTLSR